MEDNLIAQLKQRLNWLSEDARSLSYHLDRPVDYLENEFENLRLHMSLIRHFIDDIKEKESKNETL